MNNQDNKNETIVLLWRILVTMLLFISIFLIANINRISNNENNQSVDILNREMKAYIGDIGQEITDDNLKLIVNKADCSQAQFKDFKTSKSKLCLINLNLESLSEIQLNKNNILLAVNNKTYDTRISQTQFTPTNIDSSIVADNEIKLSPNNQAEVDLIFDLDLQDNPYMLTITYKDQNKPFIVYLDDQSNNYSFKCRDSKNLEVGKAVKDCGYEYTLEDVSCSNKHFNLNNVNVKFCFASFYAKNISDEFHQESPFTPNIIYQDIYTVFGNHDIYLVDQNGNRYGNAYSDNDYNSLIDQHDVKLPVGFIDLPSLKDAKDLAPQEQFKTFKTFLVNSKAKITSNLLLERPYWYDYNNTKASTPETSNSNMNNLDTNSCTTCGYR